MPTLNRKLQAAIFRVADAQLPTKVKITASVMSRASKNEISIKFIESLSIVRDFTEQYADDILMEFSISPIDYAKLYDNSDDLKVTLTFEYVNENDNQPIENTKPFKRTWRGMLVNAVDVRSAAHGIEVMRDPKFKGTLRLIDELAYDIYQRKYSGILRNVKLADAIRFISSNAFGINTVHMSPPDNVSQYVNFSIPPAKGLQDIILYIQETYGIYAGGVCSYVCDDTLYIWPPYDTDRTDMSKTRGAIYLGQSGELAGASSFHRVGEDGKLELIIDGDQIDIQDYSQMSGENVGTGFMYTRASTVFDRVKVDSSGNLSINDKNDLVVQNKNARLASSSRVNIRVQSGAKDNIFTELEKIAKGQSQIIRATWNRGQPFIMSPGHPVWYYGSGDNTLREAPGRFEMVEVNYIRIGSAGADNFVFQPTCIVEFRVEPTKENR